MIFANYAHSVAFPTSAYGGVFDLLSLLGYMLVGLWVDFLVWFFFLIITSFLEERECGKGRGKVEPFPFYFSMDSFDS